MEGLQTAKQVFEHFKPDCDVSLEKEDGTTIKEHCSFSSIADFDLKKLNDQNAYLGNLSMDNDQYLEMVKQLGTNKCLQKLIEDPVSKAVFIAKLRVLTMELDEIDKQ